MKRQPTPTELNRDELSAGAPRDGSFSDAALSSETPQTKLREYHTFVLRALRQPATIGAVLPTSRFVASAVAGVLPTSEAPTVLELGPGTGALSEAIHHRLPQRARHIALEIDTRMVSYLRSAKPWLDVVEGDAAELTTFVEQRDLTKIDAVVSSIPWTLLPLKQQRELLNQVRQVLSPHGVFTAITYLTALWRPGSAAFLHALHSTFDEVLPRSTVWRNTPPARVLVCRRPKR